MNQDKEKQLAAKISRDAKYRIAALRGAIARAGQDGGVTGTFDVYGTAEEMYQWLKGTEGMPPPKPKLEK